MIADRDRSIRNGLEFYIKQNIKDIPLLEKNMSWKIINHKSPSSIHLQIIIEYKEGQEDHAKQSLDMCQNDQSGPMKILMDRIGPIAWPMEESIDTRLNDKGECEMSLSLAWTIDERAMFDRSPELEN